MDRRFVIISICFVGAASLFETQFSEFQGPSPATPPLNFTIYYPAHLAILGYTNQYMPINHLFSGVIPEEALPTANITFKVFFESSKREMEFEARNFSKGLLSETNSTLTFSAVLTNLNCMFYRFDPVHLWMVEDFLVIWVSFGDSQEHHTENVFLIYIDVNMYSPSGFIKTQLHGILMTLYPNDAHLSKGAIVNTLLYSGYIKSGYCPIDVILVVKSVFIYVSIIFGIGLLIGCQGCKRNRQRRVVAWMP